MARIQWVKPRFILMIGAGIGLLGVGLPIVLSALSMLLLLNQTCRSYLTTDVMDADTPQWVEFKAGHLTRNAAFYPSSSRAAVIIAPGHSSHASLDEDYARMFVAHGLNVLVINSRRCDDARQTLGYLEGADVQAAYEYLAGRSDIDPERVSVHGFSAAGAAALFGAAQTPNLRAVSAMGNYHDMTQAFSPNAYWEYPIHWGVRFGFWMGTGQSIERLKPIEVIDDITPRPILFVYGSDEPALEGGKAMAERAEPYGDLWIVPNAGHGDYWLYSVEEVSKRLGGFHAKYLLNEDT